jgi:hypothetical protein
MDGHVQRISCRLTNENLVFGMHGDGRVYLIVVISTQCTCTLNHHTVYLEYVQSSSDSYFKIRKRLGSIKI